MTPRPSPSGTYIAYQTSSGSTGPRVSPFARVVGQAINFTHTKTENAPQFSIPPGVTLSSTRESQGFRFGSGIPLQQEEQEETQPSKKRASRRVRTVSERC
jgi:hypothetical protein